MWWLLLLPLTVFAKEEEFDFDKLLTEESDVTPPQELIIEKKTEPVVNPKIRDFRPMVRKVSMETILRSGVETVYLGEKIKIIRLADDEKVHLIKPVYVKVFRKPDEFGFKYLVDAEQKAKFKTHVDNVTSINEELVLYEPPHRYTPAPKIYRKIYDKKLNLLPEASFYAGVVKGDFMKDLFNDTSAGNGFTQQYGAHLFTEWKLPVKIGAALHYENTSYNLGSNDKVNYSAFSFGPLFKSQDFHFGETPLRVQAQFRFSPLATATNTSSQDVQQFKFNSTDFMASLEHPIRNDYGAFVAGIFFQAQWLNIKNQTRLIDVNASNATNKTFGLSLSQVFQ